MPGLQERDEIEISLRAGHSKVEVAHMSGASLRSVKLKAQEGPVVHGDDAGEGGERQIRRPGRVGSFLKPVVETLHQTTDLPHMRVFAG